MKGRENPTRREGINRYILFVAVILIMELALGGCLLYICSRATEENDDRLYRVEAERVAKQLREHETDIDLSDYETIVSVSPFLQGDDGAVEDEYNSVVKDINGTLYRIGYVRRQENKPLSAIAVVWLFLFCITAFSFIFVWKKILKPFYDISGLPVELAKGNLTMPVKAEKSRFFGDFLWGMDMLRETLEDSRRRELEMQKERQTLLLSLSHDIKTPLSVIELSAKALSNHLYDTEEKQSEACLGIEKNVKEIHQYLDKIVRASREDYLDLEVEVGDFYLSEVMREIESYYAPKLSVLHTELVMEEMTDCLLIGDSERVIEILQNLMENAIKYGDGKSIRISCDEEENCRLIHVENTGCTLREEELTNLLEPFYRGSNSKGVGGSGLGLSICRNLIRKMDGDIFVEPEGDLFRATLVVRKA